MTPMQAIALGAGAGLATFAIAAGVLIWDAAKLGRRPLDDREPEEPTLGEQALAWFDKHADELELPPLADWQREMLADLFNGTATLRERRSGVSTVRRVAMRVCDGLNAELDAERGDRG